MTAPRPALWRQLQAAARAVAAVATGHPPGGVLDTLPRELRGGAQALCFDTLRRLGLARALRVALAPRNPSPAIDALLCVALALASDPADASPGSEAAHYDAHTLVDQAVEAAKRDPATRGAAGFVNACLRRFLREQAELTEQALRRDSARNNHPDWWIQRLRADHPEHWRELLAAARRRAAMTVRVNRRHLDRDSWLQRLREAGGDGQPVGEVGVQLSQPWPVDRLPGFADGDVSVQDAAAQLAAPLLLNALENARSSAGRPPGRRARILDACAAPGGKTAHLLEHGHPDASPQATPEVLALDADPTRVPRIHDTLARLRLSAEVRCADAGRPDTWWDGRPFDAILLDAPCTASGIVRRHPDIPWLRRASDIDRLAAEQARLLAALWPLLTPGGVLLYCTCSLFRAEGEQQVAAFVAHNTDAALQPAPGHLLPRHGAGAGQFLENPSGDHDGFFYALLSKVGG